jgi:hypothetical protein
VFSFYFFSIFLYTLWFCFWTDSELIKVVKAMILGEICGKRFHNARAWWIFPYSNKTYPNIKQEFKIFSGPLRPHMGPGRALQARSCFWWKVVELKRSWVKIDAFHFEYTIKNDRLVRSQKIYQSNSFYTLPEIFANTKKQDAKI